MEPTIFSTPEDKLNAKREVEKFKRIWKNYRWTRDMYMELGTLQGWRCAGCGREAKEMPLNIDHFHFKITLTRNTTGFPYRWKAETRIRNQGFMAFGHTQKEAKLACWEMAVPYSVRGLLCAGRYAGCNRKFGRIDDSKWLRTMADYADTPPALQVLKA